MSKRREPDERTIERVREHVRGLRWEGAESRETHDPDLSDRRAYRDDEPPAPPGGWPPTLDDEGHVIPDPPPSEPTDVQP